MLKLGMEIYQYQPGMMHAKVLMVDDKWAMSGSANLDNRSLHLNFEVCCLLYSADLVTDLESAFLNDLSRSVRLDAAVFARRSFSTRLKENACRLLSPIL
jgi:phosphatidylserine/phosphatidylglycerophosphate/cardiolipin synthase-like enzyme